MPAPRFSGALRMPWASNRHAAAANLGRTPQMKMANYPGTRVHYRSPSPMQRETPRFFASEIKTKARALLPVPILLSW